MREPVQARAAGQRSAPSTRRTRRGSTRIQRKPQAVANKASPATARALHTSTARSPPSAQPRRARPGRTSEAAAAPRRAARSARAATRRGRWRPRPIRPATWTAPAASRRPAKRPRPNGIVSAETRGPRAAPPTTARRASGTSRQPIQAWRKSETRGSSIGGMWARPSAFNAGWSRRCPASTTRQSGNGAAT